MERITWRQRRAIAALVRGASKTVAAEAAGVSRSTLYTWLAQQAFRAELKRAETAALDDVSLGLVVLSDQALAVFASILGDAGEQPAIRLRAANWLLQRLIQLRQLVDLEERVSQLEQQLLANYCEEHTLHE